MVSTHLKNISQIGSFPQVGVKIKNVWNHHLVLSLLDSKEYQEHEKKTIWDMYTLHWKISQEVPCLSPFLESFVKKSIRKPFLQKGHVFLTVNRRRSNCPTWIPGTWRRTCWIPCFFRGFHDGDVGWNHQRFFPYPDAKHGMGISTQPFPLNVATFHLSCR